MKSQLQPWPFLPVILVGWINRQQQYALGYLRTEKRILREKLEEYSRKAVRGSP